MPRSKTKPYPGVSHYRDRHGKLRWRYRHQGRSVEIPGPYGSADFKAAYEAAVQNKPIIRSRAKPGTISWLIDQYQGSLRFKNLTPNRRTTVRYQLGWIREKVGDLPIDKCQSKHVEALMLLKEGPSAANHVRKAFSYLYNFAIKKLAMHHLHNPAQGADRMRERKGGYHTWTEAEIAKYLATHPVGSQARLATLLVLNTGASRSDLVGMGWQHVSGQRVIYSRQKTGVMASLPILPELAEELLHVPRDRMLFITRNDGAPRSVKALGAWFSKQTEAAGLTNCSLHGLRKAGAARLALAGATADEIKAFLAHTTAREGSTYTDAADRAALADNAFGRLVKGSK